MDVNVSCFSDELATGLRLVVAVGDEITAFGDEELIDSRDVIDVDDWDAGVGTGIVWAVFGSTINNKSVIINH